MMSSTLSTLLDRQTPGHSLTREFYTDPSLYESDLETIHYRQWLFAVPACQLEKPGQYVTYQVGRYPILIVRGADGLIRAFHNVCRHRGAVLCEKAQGSAPKLVCPYHQWTYELDGTLLYARDMGEDFERGEHGLMPVHCRDVAGLVFVCLAAQAPPFDDFERQARRYLAPHSLQEAKLAHATAIVEHGNWKLVLENNRECYHCPAKHPELCRTYFEVPETIGKRESQEQDPETEAHWARCEAIGAPSRFLIDPAGSWRFVRMPLLRDSESYTMSGKAAVARPLGRFPFRDAGSLLMFNYPTMWSHFLADHTVLFRVTPISPTTSEVCTFWLVHREAQQGRDYDVDTLTHVWTHTNAEDRALVEATQRGVESPAYTPGRCSPVHEAGVLQFLQWYTDTLRAGPASRAGIRIVPEAIAS